MNELKVSRTLFGLENQPLANKNTRLCLGSGGGGTVSGGRSVGGGCGFFCQIFFIPLPALDTHKLSARLETVR